MKISFLIRTLNEADDLQKTLKLIHTQNGNHNIEVIIVDSGSTDDTLNIAKKNNCKILLMNQEEWSWGSSLNYGFENIKNDYVVIISAHCFLSSLDFINNLEKLVIKYSTIVGFYGQQIALEYYDPFEEYELYNWYPNKEVKMNKKSQLIGISNACSIVKRTIWLKYKYNDTVDSLEDSIWAHKVMDEGYELLYSNKISVYHSHKFNPEYIYRKWYWRTYESNKFMSNYNLLSSYKKVLKYLVYSPYTIIKSIVEVIKMYFFFKRRYDFIQIIHIISFIRIKNLAIINAFYDSKNKFFNNSYWKLVIPQRVSLNINRFSKLCQQLKIGLKDNE